MSEKHVINKCAAQGDVMFVRVDAIGDDAKQADMKPGEQIIVAHSETGHNHVVEGSATYHTIDNNPLIAYIEVQSEFADIVHQRTFDTHQTLTLPKGFWQVRRQREHTPEGWRMVED